MKSSVGFVSVGFVAGILGRDALYIYCAGSTFSTFKTSC